VAPNGQPNARNQLVLGAGPGGGPHVKVFDGATGKLRSEFMAYEPADKGLPAATVWSTEPYLQLVPRLFQRLREELGPDVHLLHDVHHRLTPIEAARLGQSLEPYHLFWLEDPVPADLQEGVTLLAAYSLGLAVPFLLLSLGVPAFTSLSRRLGPIVGVTQAASGVLLVGMGFLLITGRWLPLIAPILSWYAQAHWPPT